MTRVSSWSPSGMRPRVHPQSLAYIFSSNLTKRACTIMPSRTPWRPPWQTNSAARTYDYMVLVASPADADINTSDTITPSIEMHGPITTSQTQWLNHQVNSFLYSSTSDLENRLLLNDLIFISNHRIDHGEHVGHQGVLESQRDMHAKVEIQSNSEFQSLTLSPTRSPRPLCLQIDAHDMYDLRFGRSSYSWKDKEIRLPTQLVSCPTKIGVTCNYQKRLFSRTFLVCHNLFWTDGPCIELKSVRGAS
jgi:hypothetical protein